MRAFFDKKFKKLIFNGVFYYIFKEIIKK